MPENWSLVHSMGQSFFGTQLMANNNELLLTALGRFMDRVPPEAFQLRGGRVELTCAPTLQILKALFRSQVELRKDCIQFKRKLFSKVSKAIDLITAKEKVYD